MDSKPGELVFKSSVEDRHAATLPQDCDLAVGNLHENTRLDFVMRGVDGKKIRRPFVILHQYVYGRPAAPARFVPREDLPMAGLHSNATDI